MTSQHILNMLRQNIMNKFMAIISNSQIKREKVLERHNYQSLLTQAETDGFNSSVSVQELGFVAKNIPTKYADAFNGEFYQVLMKK